MERMAVTFAKMVELFFKRKASSSQHFKSFHCWRPVAVLLFCCHVLSPPAAEYALAGICQLIQPTFQCGLGHLGKWCIYKIALLC